MCLCVCFGAWGGDLFWCNSTLLYYKYTFYIILTSTHILVLLIIIGSVYCDGILRSSGFDGEGVQSSSVLVVKQHTPSPKWTDIKNVPQYDQKVSSYRTL